MDSPRSSSETATFLEERPSSALLLEDYASSSTSTSPPPYTPHPSDRDRKQILYVQVAIFTLNFICIPLPLFGGLSGSFIPLQPITFFASGLTMFPLAIALGHVNSSSTIPSEQRGRKQDAQVGAKRVAVLVEDPVTGEERWMLEPDEKNKYVPMQKWILIVVNVFAMIVLLVSVILSLVFARHTPGSLAVVVVMRGVMLLLLAGVNWRIWKVKLLDAGDREGNRGREDLPDA